MPYAFPGNAHLYCPGWTPEKSAAVDRIISRAQWEKMKLVHIMGRLICSHAGISRHVFEHPIRGMTAESIGKICREALSAARAGLFHHATAWSPFPDDGRSGLTWLRWWEMPVLPEFCQVVGHTPGELRYEFENGSFKVCLDTHGEWAGLVEHDIFHVVSTGTLPTVTLGSIAL